MNKMKTLLAVASALVVSGASGAMAVDATGTASAVIASAITISETSQMSFGTVAASATQAGSVVLSAAGSASDSNITRLSGATPAAGTFTVNGANSATYAVTLPSSAVTLTSGANTMSVNSFTTNATGTLSSGGSEVFGVGATLSIGANQASGSYTGSYTVTVNYN